MKNPLIISLLIIASSQATAEWKKVETSTNWSGEKFTGYLDTTTIQRNDKTIRAWYLVDYEDKVRSERGEVAFECDGEGLTQLSVFYHEQNMGLGEGAPWLSPHGISAPPPPDIMGIDFRKLVCP